MTFRLKPVNYRIPLALALVSLAACGGEGPQTPSEFIATGSTSNSATVASTVAAVPSVKVSDAKGRGISNVLVRWRVSAGGGKVVNDSIRTDKSGQASSGGWTLGTAAGAQTLQATASGLSPVTFTAEALAGAPTRMQFAAGLAQHATVGTVIPVPPAVKVEDLYGNPVADVMVNFAVSVGGGSLVGSQQATSAQGIATLGGWTLGTTSGDQALRIAAGSLGELSLTAVADAGPLDDLRIVSGSGTLDGATRAPSPSTPVVRTVDSYGNAVGNIPVTFTPSAGSGGVSSSTVISNPVTGVASTMWTLGSEPQQTMIASMPAVPGKLVTFSANAFASDYDIQVRFVGDGGTELQRDAFAKAVVRWRKIITSTMHTTRIIAPAGDCASWIPALDETVRDLVVYARLTPIDGVGKILGQAGPCYTNGSSKLTALGVMEFDLDDLPKLISDGTLDAVVLHEVGHVLGIGTLWNYRRSLLVGQGTEDPYFIGDSARAQFSSHGGGMYGGLPIPVENSGGPGTRDAHWRQTIFGRELMQGYANRGGSPLSATTSASLYDLGYRGVMVGNSDSFTFGTSSFLDSPATIADLHDDIAPLPLVEYDQKGERKVIKPQLRR